MAYYNNMASVKVAAPKASHFNLSHNTICTTDFNILQPVTVRETVPGDKFRVKINSFTRLAPMPCPTYGQVKIVNRAFYVPYRTVMPGFQEFLDDTTYQGAYGLMNPVIPQCVASDLFLTFIQLGDLRHASQSERAQYVFEGENYVFSDRGKRIYSVLVSLGYQLEPGDTTLVSLLPLLCYAKVYLDWYTPSQYSESSPIRKFLRRESNSIWNRAELADFLRDFSTIALVEKDYFTSAWPKPNQPVDFVKSSYQFQDTNFMATHGGTVNVGTGVIGADTSPFTNYDPGAVLKGALAASMPIYSISQYGLDVLHAVDHVLKRNMITGNRYNEQLLARYGVKISNIVLGRSEYLGSTSDYVQISDVMSTADTSSSSEVSNLGDYAGKGVGSSHSSFNLEADEFGLFLVLSCMVPSTGYVQGKRRELVKHLTRTQFFTPEFDMIGTQPITTDELVSNHVEAPSYAPDSIFAWSPRYSEYKCAFDVLAGDFLDNRFNLGMDSWHLFRDFQNTHPVFGMSFMSGDPNSTINNFGRIWNVNAGADHFINVYQVEFSAYRHMAPLADSLVTEGSREVDIPFNGYQL